LAALLAACSMLDRPVLMLFIEAFALLTSTSTTSSSLLLSAMVSRQLLPLQPVPLLGDDHHGLELIRGDFVERDPHPKFQRAHDVQRATNHQPAFGRLGGIDLVERAAAAPGAAILRRVRTELLVAQLLAPHRPMHEEPERRILRPLAYCAIGLAGGKLSRS